MGRITVLVSPRSPNGLAIIADADTGRQSSIYLAKRHPGGRWEPWPMPEAWRQSLEDIGFNVPRVAPMSRDSAPIDAFRHLWETWSIAQVRAFRVRLAGIETRWERLMVRRRIAKARR